jgi:hypothetical protein
MSLQCFQVLPRSVLTIRSCCASHVEQFCSTTAHQHARLCQMQYFVAADVFCRAASTLVIVNHRPRAQREDQCVHQTSRTTCTLQTSMMAIGMMSWCFQVGYRSVATLLFFSSCHACQIPWQNFAGNMNEGDKRMKQRVISRSSLLKQYCTVGLFLT